ncbi:hypothetical protein [Sandaracinobacter neustonicus]|nr:hypothetical protein [Sandaracinobacter neustonicus]
MSASISDSENFNQPEIKINMIDFRILWEDEILENENAMDREKGEMKF